MKDRLVQRGVGVIRSVATGKRGAEGIFRSDSKTPWPSSPTHRMRRSGRHGMLAGFPLLSFLCLLSAVACTADFHGRYDSLKDRVVYHRVAPGETLWSIARDYGIDVDRIRRLNGIRDPRTLLVGQKILLSFASSFEALPLEAETPEEGRGVAGSSTLFWPTAGGRIVSGFGPRSGSFHDGIDIAAPSGTPVYASASGVVAYAGSGLRGYGRLVVLRHKGGAMSVYAHNSRILVSKGKRVSRGEEIAKVGQTGKASGPHLHFEVRVKNRAGKYLAIDPLPLLGRGGGGKPRYRANDSLTPLLVQKSGAGR